MVRPADGVGVWIAVLVELEVRADVIDGRLEAVRIIDVVPLRACTGEACRAEGRGVEPGGTGEAPKSSKITTHIEPGEHLDQGLGGVVDVQRDLSGVVARGCGQHVKRHGMPPRRSGHRRF